MSGPRSILKKPKLEQNDDVKQPTTKASPMLKEEENNNNNREEQNGVGEEGISREDQEQALVALVEHRTNEVEHLTKRVSYYQNQLREAERKLNDSQAKLARLRTGNNAVSSKNETEKLQSRTDSPVSVDSRNHSRPRTQLVIPSVNPKLSEPAGVSGSSMKASIVSNSSAQRNASAAKSGLRIKEGSSDRSSDDVQIVEVRNRGVKRKLEHTELQERKESKELIPLVCSKSSPITIPCNSSNHFPSQHNRKLRSLAVCPMNDRLFVTSALDGCVKLWQLNSRGSDASLLSTTHCLSPKQMRWPEDLAWHTLGNRLFLTYSADGGDSQISILDLNKAQEKECVTFLEAKPHVRGTIHSVISTPWEISSFVTGGSDHAVVLWTEQDSENNSWKPKTLHRNLHSSAVMGVAGMQQKRVIVSAGADKRTVGFDVQSGRADFKYSLDSKCMSVIPNPCDFNLFMVQTGTPEKQLRLYDVRLRQTEIHTFGFKQESSESQSALINQSWSPDGLYLSSGSVDPVIHVFDIRYNSRKPSQSIRAHQKRVFKAVWHYSLPLLISISSDLHIGLHKILR